jgi:mono/diheme cytochrome c family protein
MREMALATAAMACATVAAQQACAAAGASSDLPFAARPLAESVRAGAQLAAVGNCAVCHTTPGGIPFAGGRAFDTPFGTLYSTNISPDPKTGIGQWSPRDFSRAMKSGISRDGHRLYPAFPYPHFQGMTDIDLESVYRFLMTRAPVQVAPPKNHLTFPLQFRPLMAAWNMLFLHRPAEPQRVPDRADEKRGKYLVDTLGHCATCHTPLNALGAEKTGHALQGAVVEGWEAPALTALLERPKPWTVEQLSAYMRTGLASEHGMAAGPMRDVTSALAYADPADVRAMASYLMTLQTTAAPAQAATSTADQVDSAQLRRGSTLFAAACASCHDDAAPMSAYGGRPSLSLGTSVNARSARNAVRFALHGIRDKDSAGALYMPAYSATLTNAQIADVTAFVRARFSTQAPWRVDASYVAKLRKEKSEP